MSAALAPQRTETGGVTRANILLVDEWNDRKQWRQDREEDDDDGHNSFSLSESARINLNMRLTHSTHIDALHEAKHRAVDNQT